MTAMRRVVVTGLGIVSSIGNNANEVLASLREARSGVVAAPEYKDLGFRCQVHAAPHIDWETMVDRRAARFLAPGTAGLELLGAQTYFQQIFYGAALVASITIPKVTRDRFFRRRRTA